MGAGRDFTDDLWEGGFWIGKEGRENVCVRIWGPEIAAQVSNVPSLREVAGRCLVVQELEALNDACTHV